jgi:ribosome-associated protein
MIHRNNPWDRTKRAAKWVAKAATPASWFKTHPALIKRFGSLFLDYIIPRKARRKFLKDLDDRLNMGREKCLEVYGPEQCQKIENAAKSLGKKYLDTTKKIGSKAREIADRAWITLPGSDEEFDAWIDVFDQELKAARKSEMHYRRNAKEKPKIRDFQIPDHEIDLSFATSGGPGGQHVNKTATKVRLKWNLTSSGVFSDAEKETLTKEIPALYLQVDEITEEWHVVITSSRTRSQRSNINDAKVKLHNIVREALKPKKIRKFSKTPKRAKEARLRDKKIQKQKKEGRQKPDYRFNPTCPRCGGYR